MRRFIISLAALLFLFCLPLAALAAPQVLATYPANNATNMDPTYHHIWIKWDSSMDLSSFTSSQGNSRISISGSRNAVVPSYTLALVNYLGYDWIDVQLSGDLTYNKTYTVEINYRVKDTNGNQMGSNSNANYSWSFSTAASPPADTTPPTVTSTSPTTNAVDVPVTSVITINFSEQVASATVNSTNIQVQTSAGTTVAGTYALDTAGDTVTFTPTANLGSYATYTVTVTTGVKDVAGNALQSQYSWSFRTIQVDNVPPTITLVSPINGATGVDTGTVITAIFSEAMTASTISTANFTVSGGVTGTVTYDPVSWTATFTPSAALAYSTNYTVTVTTGVKDLAGNALAAAKTWTFTTAQNLTPPPLTDYCQMPPFVTNASTSIKPNVLLVVDNSGSMYEFAYKAAGSNPTSNYDTSYNPATSYYGYFDNTKMYSYTGQYFQVDSSVATDKTQFLSGNLLNWLTMRRIDIIRKVLVGGKTQPRSAGTANYLYPAEDPDRDFYKSYNNVKYKVSAGSSTEQVQDQTNNRTYNLKIYVGDQLPQEGLLLQYTSKINFGIMNFNDGYRYEDSTNSVKDGGSVTVDIGATGNNLITQVENTDPSTWTPLAESLYEAIRYFQAVSSAYNGGTYSGKDPIQYKCQKNFVLILTDGESTKDQNVPGTSFSGGTKVTDSYGFDVKTWMDSIATQEGYASQKNTAANTDKGSYYLEGVAYYAHNTDLRTSTVGKSNIDGMQNLITYTVFAFDDSAVGRDLLKKTAKYGGFDDYDHTGKPDKTNKWDKNGDGVPDTYFEAQNGDRLAAAIMQALNDILARVSSGTAASILSNSEGSGANILQAMFYPKKFFDLSTTVDWIGELHSLWYFIDPFITNSSVREDSDYTDTTHAAPHYMNLGTDKVVNFYFNTAQNKTLVKRYTDLRGDGIPDVDTNGNGTLDSFTFFDEVDPDYVNSLWRGGQSLLARSAASRNIYTQMNGTSLVDLKIYDASSPPTAASCAPLDICSYLDTSQATVRNYLQAANKTEADKIINYVRGTDQSGYRSRTITFGGVTGVWKLGDIVTSTPRLQSSIKLNSYNLSPPNGYNDVSYGKFIKQTSYQNRGITYVGSNDGMLHAFKLGILDVRASGDKRATLSGTNLGKEEWAFIPRNVLPYLRYLGDTNYISDRAAHLYFVDGVTVLNDVSIGRQPDNTKSYFCDTTTSYELCPKDLNNGTNWRTVLVGSMGFGGASRLKGAGCKGTTCVETPTLDPADNSKGLGYSSYYALDITNQSFNSVTNALAGPPTLMWEFSDPALGFATAGPAVVKIAARPDGTTPDLTRNGKWYVVLASGPTGPIDGTSNFLGKSDQPLTLIVLDMATGAKLATIDKLADNTQVTNAFAGSITNAPIDTERTSSTITGYYQDNALYIGYVQKNASTSTWTDGGVLRLMTNENPDPTTWKLSKVIDGVGPVTTNIARLIDRGNPQKLWLYFGTGRYYAPLDDSDNRRLIAGMLEPCFSTGGTLDGTCTTKKSLSDLTDVTSGTVTSFGPNGWYINLTAKDAATSYGAERCITDPVAMPNGVVFFTTFSPTTDACGFGGNSYMWGVNFETGQQPPSDAIQAKALIQVSTGSFEQIDLATALTGNQGRRTGTPMIGKPPSDPPPIVSKANLKPVRKIVHIQEN